MSSSLESSREVLDTVCGVLASHAAEVDETDAWPAAQLRLLGDSGLFSWFTAEELGGDQWPETDLIEAYIALARSCLTTTFILTQRQGAMSRIAASENESLRSALLPDLLTGKTFATLGISHLTTSRRYLGRPAMRAAEKGDGYVLDGESPWVTGAAHAQHVILGATLDDGRQMLVALPNDAPGVSTPAWEKLIALSASHTGRLVCERVAVSAKWVLAGPSDNLLQAGRGTRTGGLQTSALALGVASAAIELMRKEAQQRAHLELPQRGLWEEWDTLRADLLNKAQDCDSATADELRSRANSLVLRATQAALAAAKGTGFVRGHPAGRWCREALFFLVWSCPQNVLAANLCEFAGLEA